MEKIALLPLYRLFFCVLNTHPNITKIIEIVIIDFYFNLKIYKNLSIEKL